MSSNFFNTQQARVAALNKSYRMAMLVVLRHDLMLAVSLLVVISASFLLFSSEHRFTLMGGAVVTLATVFGGLAAAILLKLQRSPDQIAPLAGWAPDKMHHRGIRGMPQENYDGFKAGFYAAKLGVRVRTLITQTLIRLVVFESMLIGIATFIGVFGDHLYNRLFQCGRWIC